VTRGERHALRGALDDQALHEARITRLLGIAGRRNLLKQLAKLCQLRKIGSLA
jgi:hypothetical protein